MQRTTWWYSALLIIASAGAGAAEPPREAPAAVQSLKRPIKVAPVEPAPVKLVRVEPASTAVPNGSYLGSCAPVRVDGDTLHGNCDTGKGRRDSSISVSRCAGVDIANHYGQLRCLTRVRAHWGEFVLPAGSYINSCGAKVVGTVLKAACGTGEGEHKMFGITMSSENVRGAELELSTCPDGADIANLRGHLTCVK